LDFKHPKRKFLADFAKIYPRNGPIDDPSCAAINTPCMEGYRGFPENAGSPSYHPFIDGFSIINQRAWGTPFMDLGCRFVRDADNLGFRSCQ